MLALVPSLVILDGSRVKDKPEKGATRPPPAHVTDEKAKRRTKKPVPRAPAPAAGSLSTPAASGALASEGFKRKEAHQTAKPARAALVGAERDASKVPGKATEGTREGANTKRKRHGDQSSTEKRPRPAPPVQASAPADSKDSAPATVPASEAAVLVRPREDRKGLAKPRDSKAAAVKSAGQASSSRRTVPEKQHEAVAMEEDGAKAAPLKKAAGKKAAANGTRVPEAEVAAKESDGAAEAPTKAVKKAKKGKEADTAASGTPESAPVPAAPVDGVVVFSRAPTSARAAPVEVLADAGWADEAVGLGGASAWD
jgi:hypothetical protein